MEKCQLSVTKSNFGQLAITTFKEELTKLLSSESLKFEHYHSIGVVRLDYDTATQVLLKLLTDILQSIDLFDEYLSVEVSNTKVKYDLKYEIINGIELYRVLGLFDVLLPIEDESMTWLNQTSTKCQIGLLDIPVNGDNEQMNHTIKRDVTLIDQCLTHNICKEEKCVVQMCYRFYLKAFWHEERTRRKLNISIKPYEILIDRQVTKCITELILNMFGRTLRGKEVRALLIIVNKASNDVQSSSTNLELDKEKRRNRITRLIIELIKRRKEERPEPSDEEMSYDESTIRLLYNNNYDNQGNFQNTTDTTEIKIDDEYDDEQSVESILRNLFSYFKEQILNKLDIEFSNNCKQYEFEQEIVLPLLITTRIFLSDLKKTRELLTLQRDSESILTKLMIIANHFSQSEDTIISEFIIRRIAYAIKREGTQHSYGIVQAWLAARAATSAMRRMR